MPRDGSQTCTRGSEGERARNLARQLEYLGRVSGFGKYSCTSIYRREEDEWGRKHELSIEGRLVGRCY